MFTVYVGAVGTGKTYSLVRQAMFAFEKGERVFANIDIDVSNWNNANGGEFFRWHKPVELCDPAVHCGTVLFDELGASVNNRESDFWPLELTIKLIEHRKDHLDFFATVQDDELADKNVRRFYNQVKFVSEHRWPLVGLLFPTSVRTDLRCPYPDCRKGDGCLTRGDKKGILGWGTFYSAYDVHPQDTKNKYKHRSKGTERYLWSSLVANAYASSEKVASDALESYKELVQKSAQRRRFYGRR
jgi:hypothetical protein